MPEIIPEHDTESNQFLHGQSLKASLLLLPYYGASAVSIMVPYLVRGELLKSILALPDTIKVKIYTRDKRGYLPNIKDEAQPAIELLKKKRNIQIFIDNRIHAKIWMVDEKIAIVHSMNGTRHSENFNLEAGIMTNSKRILKEIVDFFKLSEGQAVKL